MRNVVSLVYAVLMFFATQRYFARAGNASAGYVVGLAFAYFAFNIPRLTLSDWAAFIRSPIDHVSFHARIIINMLAPFLATAILVRILYVVTGMSPLWASLLMAYPWLWMTHWVYKYLFPVSEDTPQRGIFRFFVPMSPRREVGE